jgi:ribose transport system substrate-binding protein
MKRDISRRSFMKTIGIAMLAVGSSPIAVLTRIPRANASNPAWTPQQISSKFGQELVCHATELLAHPVDADHTKGIKLACEAFGQKYMVLENKYQGAKAIADVEDAIARGARMIPALPVDAATSAAVAKACERAKVFTAFVFVSPAWFTPLDVGNHFVMFLSPDLEQQGYEMTKYLFEKIGKKGNVVNIEGIEGSSSSLSIRAGIDRALRSYPEVKLLNRQPGNWDPVVSQKVMADFLTAYPKIDGAVGQDDGIALGIHAACREAGRKIPIVGLNGTKEAALLIRDSFFLASHAGFSAWQGGFMVARLFDALHGFKPAVPERMMFNYGMLVTRENVDKYLGTFYGSSPLPYDWTKMSRVLHPNDWDPQNGLIPVRPIEYFSRLGIPMPANYILPKQYEKADFEGVKKLYDSHWKKRIF